MRSGMNEIPADAVRDLDGLKSRMQALFALDELTFMDTGSHGIMFGVAGTPRARCLALQEITGPEHWSEGDGVAWTYRNDQENVLIMLSRGGRGLTLVTATVVDLHLRYLQQFSGALGAE